MNEIFSKDALIEEITNFLSAKVEGFSLEDHADTSLSRLGLDSAGHVQLTTVIEDFIQSDVAPTLAFDYPTVNSLIDYVCDTSQTANQVN
ncbi:acyl carrier protein [Alteromonas sp. ASW11-130]|uniref:acyl carrier protein n=1 Tax=Alteromonas sp. ASW11-130 TaxID=3015775 RepID=UPI0022421AEB|nr:acyl carrier protein [Alteromonas sp. ASW11-130]MCW8093456.1 acyl carrier protein [Alteromonas sp. ASW11-130]